MKCPASQKRYGMLMLLHVHKLTATTILLLFLLPAITFSQTLSIKGKITDDKGLPVSGVTVQEKGTSASTITDANGNYTLGNVNPKATIIFSHVGYITQSIPAGNRSVIDISLASSATDLENVVVIG